MAISELGHQHASVPQRRLGQAVHAVDHPVQGIAARAGIGRHRGRRVQVRVLAHRQVGADDHGAKLAREAQAVQLHILCIVEAELSVRQELNTGLRRVVIEAAIVDTDLRIDRVHVELGAHAPVAGVAGLAAARVVQGRGGAHANAIDIGCRIRAHQVGATVGNARRLPLVEVLAEQRDLVGDLSLERNLAQRQEDLLGLDAGAVDRFHAVDRRLRIRNGVRANQQALAP